MMAQKIVDWNLKRYPEGVFFLLAQGRLSLSRSQPRRAIECYQKAMNVQSQYRNLHHLSFWEMAISNLGLWEIEESLKCWRNLHKESTWSKAVYAYGVAALLIQLGGEANKAEGLRLMTEVPKLRQRIAGKSIPLEKFVARKSRKCEAQGGRLVLPALELAYILHAVSRAPRLVIAEQMLPLVDAVVDELKRFVGSPGKYGNGSEYWDDWCLARHLEGACLRYIAYPGPDALVDPDEAVSIPQAEAAERAGAAFQSVFENGTKIELDHYVVYFAHFEYGRLLACMGDKEGARVQLDLVMSGKPLEVNAAGRKGKYSLENELHLRTNAALEALQLDKRV
jgi:tetratricopeptide (TPR) repeat protein